MTVKKRGRAAYNATFQYNKKALAELYGWTYPAFMLKWRALMSDPVFFDVFGEYKAPFTPRQMELILDEWG